MMMDSVTTKCTSVRVTWALLGLALTSVGLASGHWTQAASSQPLSSLSYLSDTHNQSTESSLVTEFNGNSSHTDHFKLLKEDGTSVLVGARNIIYNLSLPDLQEYTEQRIHWSCSAEDLTSCDLKGKGAEDCQNYIRVLSVISEGRLLVCGTNCYNPLCRHYLLDGAGHYQVEAQFSGKGYAPYDPVHNSTSLYTSGNLFAATVADFSGTDSLIIKNNLRTEQYDYKHLNAPDFVSSLEDEDHVYFFFREAAVEFMNCGKAIFSRVARVCKNDEGGSNRFRNRWTSFLKTRLNCSVPGEYPFYFDEIQSTSNFFPDPLDDKIFYAVFTTSPNSILGSAVCRFSLSNLHESFNGNFKNQERVNSNWLPMSAGQVPSPRPGQCYNDSLSIPENSLHFIKNNCLMDQPVISRPMAPVLVKFGDGELLTRIAAQRAVSDVNNNVYDVLYMGTNRGRVIKALVRADKPDMETSIIEAEIQIFSETVPVLNLLIADEDPAEARLIILSADNVKSIPLESCGERTLCLDCMTSVTCAWDMVSASCVSHRGQDKRRLVHYQHQCPVVVEPEPETTTIVHDIVETEETTVMPVVEDQEDAAQDDAEDSDSLLLSSTFPPELHPSTLSCPSCVCTCPTSAPLPTLVATPYIMDNITTNEDNEDEDDTSEGIHQESEAIVVQDFRSVEKLDEFSSPLRVESEVTSSSKQESLVVLTLTKAVTIAVVTGLACLVLGFLSGFFISRLCSHKSSASVTSSNVSLVKPCPLDKPVNVDSGYTTPTNCDNNNSNKNINIIMNGNQSKPSNSVSSKLERTKMSCTGTLQKVKRVYL